MIAPLRPRSAGKTPMRTALTIALAVLAFTSSARAQVLDNAEFRIHLGCDRQGRPCIASATWTADDRTAFGDDGASHGTGAWRITNNDSFLRAEATCPNHNGLAVTRVVDLAPSGSLFRTCVRMTNPCAEPIAVSSFPVLDAEWTLPNLPRAIRWWKALSFVPVENPLTAGHRLTLGSRLHSSDNRHGPATNPYWLIGSGADRLWFALEWCGGWEAEITGTDTGVTLRVQLPPRETQLILEPGETITGPVLSVTVTRTRDEREARAAWLAQRAAVGRALYGSPAPICPFFYNHWYTTGFDIDAAFLRRQRAHLKPYGFDFFLVDAGWYRKVGQWEPHPRKFETGAFESLLADCARQGLQVGLWTCPQFARATWWRRPPAADRPGHYERHVGGHLLDLAGSAFPEWLPDHVATLRQRYGVNWWKYDQVFFAPKTRAGTMKNVAAFQSALAAVRAAEPDLYIENCQSGGRMINEFTTIIAQTHWLRDGGGTGIKHARRNLRDALGAIQFLPPWMCNRWTNNPDRCDPANDALARYYCRSAMIGSWGLCADLADIDPGQRNVIVQEAGFYRRLNELKWAGRYDVLYPEDGASVAGVTYYDAAGTRAGVLLYRWDVKGAFTYRIPLRGLKPERLYNIEDADRVAVTDCRGRDLRDVGLPVPFDRNRLSALVFITAHDGISTATQSRYQVGVASSNAAASSAGTGGENR